LLSAQPRTSDYLIEAATLIRETVGVGDYRDAVVQLTTAADDARTTLHDLIEDLEPLGIITFNYDLGHENAYRPLESNQLVRHLRGSRDLLVAHL
jgi:hypothetical protein